METAGGVLATAAFVALPTGLPLSEVLSRWVPALHELEGPLLPVAMTLAIWVSLSAWLLAGAVEQARRTR
jgi:hypothetical protein